MQQPTLIGYVCDHCLDKAANPSNGHTTEAECQVCGERTACHAVVAREVAQRKIPDCQLIHTSRGDRR
jgi:hypothetical protein